MKNIHFCSADTPYSDLPVTNKAGQAENHPSLATSRAIGASQTKMDPYNV